MRLGITILTDLNGKRWMYPGQGEVVLPVCDDIPLQKDLLKIATVSGLKIKGKTFTKGFVLGPFGVECRKQFAEVTK